MQSLFKMVRFLFLIVVFAVVSVSSASAQNVKGYPELYGNLPGVGTVNHSIVIERALKILEKNQLLRERRIVKVSGPRDINVVNHRFISIAFDATIKKQGQARQKAAPAIYALLFEKNKANHLTFYKSIYLAWIGVEDIEEYKTIKLTKICEYYRSKGAEYVIPDQKIKKIKKAVATSLSGSHIKSGVVKEAYIDSSITRDQELTGILEGYVKKDEPDEDVDAARRISQLEARIKRLESLLANVTRKGNDIIFQRVNVRIQNGTGNADKINGTGNLIVGYGSNGKGSHNIAVGKNNAYSSVGSIVAGSENAVMTKYSFIAGGKGNKVTGDYGVITGGHDNKSEGDYSSILGGSDNKAKGKYSSINGQRGRTKVDAGKNKHFKN